MAEWWDEASGLNCFMQRMIGSLDTDLYNTHVHRRKMRSCGDWEACNLKTEGERPALKQASKKLRKGWTSAGSSSLYLLLYQQGNKCWRGWEDLLDTWMLRTECEDVKYLYICKGRGSNGGKPSSSIPISTNNSYQFQIRYQKSGSKVVRSSFYNKH